MKGTRSNKQKAEEGSTLTKQPREVESHPSSSRSRNMLVVATGRNKKHKTQRTECQATQKAVTRREQQESKRREAERRKQEVDHDIRKEAADADRQEAKTSRQQRQRMSQKHKRNDDRQNGFPVHHARSQQQACQNRMHAIPPAIAASGFAATSGFCFPQLNMGSARAIKFGCHNVRRLRRKVCFHVHKVSQHGRGLEAASKYAGDGVGTSKKIEGKGKGA